MKHIQKKFSTALVKTEFMQGKVPPFFGLFTLLCTSSLPVEVMLMFWWQYTSSPFTRFFFPLLQDTSVSALHHQLNVWHVLFQALILCSQ